MAERVYLWLRINSQDIEGESSVSSLERENSIECYSFQGGVKVPAAADPRRTGQRQYEPVVIQKRIDKSTPLLLKALCRGQNVDQAEFRFYRPSVTGEVEHFYTVKLKNGRIAGVRQVSEDPIVGGENAPPMMEEITFTFLEITWTYEIGGVEWHDSMRLPA